MRAVFGLVLLLGIALAGFSVYAVSSYVRQIEQSLRDERAFREALGPVVRVYVANKTLPYGAALTRDDVALISWQKAYLPAGTFADEAALFPPGEDKPRYIRRQIEAFEPILASKVTAAGEPAGLTGALGRGMRAFAIRVDVSTGVSGFVNPGNFVDIYWTGNDGSRDITRLIESSIEVVAVDQSAARELGGEAMVAQTVTVQVTPEQVARLAQAQATGRLALSLAPSPDDKVQGTVEVNTEAITGPRRAEDRPPALPLVPVPCTVTTRRGSEVVEVPIPCPATP
ncbi:MAG: Flp pilus assembly protein CpaB [Pseudomonadota bacterium]